LAQLQQMTIISVDELEDQLGVSKLPRFVSECESGFRERIRQISGQILANRQIKAIFISGPTASGKTTFTHRLAEFLNQQGRPTRPISLDDYYLEVSRFDDQGRPDFESIETLDTDQIVTDFSALLAGRAVKLPSFDFVTRRRIFLPENQIRLNPGALILVEGLHGLSRMIAGQLPHEQYLGVFIMPWCTLLDGRQLLGSRDLRILRRISRDVLHRGSTALSTLDYWPMIDRTEQQFFPSYLANADEYVNSCLAYEFGVIAPMSAEHLARSLEQYETGRLPGSVYRLNRQGYADLPAAVVEARDLLRDCSRIPATTGSIVPPQSILNEFIR
jgi:uridine kinase